MEGTEAVIISRKKQGVFWSAVGYTILFAALVALTIAAGGVDPFGISAFIAVRLPAMVMLLLVMATGPISVLVLMAGFAFLVIADSLSVFLYGGVDSIITLPFALAGLVFAIRSYVKVPEKARGHILSFVLTLGAMFFWVWFSGYLIGTVDTIVRGTPEARSDAIMSLWYIIGIPILIIILGGLGSRRAKRKG